MTTLLKSALVLGLLAVPAAADAQTTNWFVSPYIGATSGGGDLANSGAPTVGVSGGWKGAGWWGVEVDAAHTPGFFEQDGFRTVRRVSTIMGNVLVSVPMRSENTFSVQAAGGLGVIKPRLAEAGGLAEIDVKQAGFNVGAVVAWMKNGKGIRGDVRYFRSFGDEEDDVNAFDLEVSTLHFVRASIGLVVGF